MKKENGKRVGKWEESGRDKEGKEKKGDKRDNRRSKTSKKGGSMEEREEKILGERGRTGKESLGKNNN